jgi:uncharacterized protein DUF4412
MRRAMLACTVTLGLAWSARTAQAQAFQGMLSFTVHDADGKTTEVTEYTKPGKSSLLAHETGKAAGGLIVDSAAGTMTVVDGEKKTYTVINMAAMQQMMQGFAGMAKGLANMAHRGAADSAEHHGPKGTITPTGRTEVVAGVTCQVYSYEGDNNGHHETGEACLAKGVGLMAGGSFPGMGAMGPMGMQQRQMFQQRMTEQYGSMGELLAQGYGILKGTSFEDGKPKGSMEVTAIQRGAPPDAMFAPPAGYTEKQMSMGRP